MLSKAVKIDSINLSCLAAFVYVTAHQQFQRFGSVKSDIAVETAENVGFECRWSNGMSGSKQIQLSVGVQQRTLFHHSLGNAIDANRFKKCDLRKPLVFRSPKTRIAAVLASTLSFQFSSHADNRSFEMVTSPGLALPPHRQQIWRVEGNVLKI
jgi:hypothetical protein